MLSCALLWSTCGSWYSQALGYGKGKGSLYLDDTGCSTCLCIHTAYKSI